MKKKSCVKAQQTRRNNHKAAKWMYPFVKDSRWRIRCKAFRMMYPYYERELAAFEDNNAYE